MHNSANIPYEISDFPFPAAEEIETAFNRNVHKLKPTLFELAAEVTADSGVRKWDLILGDDTSGRLPAIFISEVLSAQGLDIPLKFICGSHTAQRVLPPESYEQYVSSLAQTASRVLVVSESAGTGDSVRFLYRCLRRQFDIVDFAIVATHLKTELDIEGNVYIGSNNPRTSGVVYQAFERVGNLNPKDLLTVAAHFMLPSSIRSKLPSKKSAPYLNFPISGVIFTEELALTAGRPPLPVALQVDDPRFGKTVIHCKKTMEQLAQEFSDKGKT